MSPLVRHLPEGPLDIIGDVHGEIDALRALLARLGCDPQRRTVERPMVFVGDLIDRGPDSPAVVRLVQNLCEAGVAWCIAGNHELNLVQDKSKEGNGWFTGKNDDTPFGSGRRPFDSRDAGPDDHDEILAFLGSMPVALERPDLRVVHACWDSRALRELPNAGDLGELGELANAADERVWTHLRDRDLVTAARAERAEFANLRDPSQRPDRELPNALEITLAEQRLNPFRVLTSGREHAIPIEQTFFVGGKWRIVSRTPWWDTYDEAPAVIVGHYWRRRAEPIPGKRDLWDGVGPTAWAGPRGNVFCVDYSVGRRFLERWRHQQSGTPEPWSFAGGLAALRWPERTLVFDDRDTHLPTTGFQPQRL